MLHSIAKGQTYELVQTITDAADVIYPAEHFGEALAITDRFLLVGAPDKEFSQYADSQVVNYGALYIYELGSSGNWELQQEIRSPELVTEPGLFGSRIEMSDSFFIVYNYRAEFENDPQAALYIFSLQASGWSFQQKIAGIPLLTCPFDAEIAINKDYIFLTNKTYDLNEKGLVHRDNTGACFIYKRSDSNIWSLNQTICNDVRIEYEYFGWQMEIWNDWLAISIPNYTLLKDNVLRKQAGCVKMYKRDETGQYVFRQLIDSLDYAPGQQVYFGMRLSLSNVGLIVGSYDQKKRSLKRYNLRQSGEWRLAEEIVYPLAPPGLTYAEMHSNRNYLAIGNEQFNTILDGEIHKGQVILYTQIHNQRIEIFRFTDPVANTTHKGFGKVFAISDSFVVLGMPLENVFADKKYVPEAGLIYIYKANYCQTRYDTLQIDACDTFLFEPSGKTYTAQGAYSDTSYADGGCINYWELNIKFSHSTFSSFDSTYCGGFSSPSGKYFFVDSRTVTDTILNTAGCDSVISIELNSLNPNLDVGVYEDRLEAKPGYSKYQWYDCYRNSPILGATHNIFHPKRAGLYYAEITNGTCTYITSCYSISSDGINKQLNNNVRAYPNPSEGKTTLEFEHEHKTITVSILNLQGQVISIQEFHNTYWLEIDLPPNAGCYIIRTEVAGFPSKSVRVFHL